MSSANSSSEQSLEIESYQPSEVHLESKPSHSEDSSQVVQAEYYINGVETIRTPYDYIFQGRSVLSLETLLEDAESDRTTEKPNCCARFCACFAKRNKNVNLIRARVVRFASGRFESTEALHGNLMLSWHSAVTGRSEFKLEQRIWQKMGFASEDPKKNELQMAGVVFVVLEMLYLKVKFPNTMQSFVSCCLNPNFKESLVSVQILMLRSSLEMFASAEAFKYLAGSRAGGLMFLLGIQSGMTALWCQAFDQAKNKGDCEGIVKLAKTKIGSISQLLSMNLS